ncbi:hypothetical protein SeMB42_g01848 [Synchytrium endobioticum]|uniref:NodB homology domain-containing protein n=1 Tax=Synchytrium endobioticum TaxID=286115 RepID=A0A507DJ86_9FUNG|nr:hypothetical protein SeMB42_g01842 [Synchytrium endobioticum]TPX51668.1 hypothetical protein SeMB42_g01845 [Synchytrium endobioticum]TPX51673.1 hypothetical protein SeMB42_g01848 [Synchytrium endobioticum]TPX51844.1 hypothetical protein SeLEV6574_g00029 [Synchytrium endobioticum]
MAPLLLTLSLLVLRASAQNFSSTAFPPAGTFSQPPCNGVCVPGPYPAQDKIPPPEDAWTRSVDLSSVPNYPPRPSTMAFGVTCTNGANASLLGPSGICDYSCGDKCWRGEVTACPTRGDWALTYDDGPSVYTISLLDALKAANLMATFFVIGSRVMERPDILHRAYQEGHEICLHTWSHSANTALTNVQIIAETLWTARVVYQVIGVVPTCTRWPYGDSDDRTRAVMKALGFRVITWNRDTFDWAISDAKIQNQTITGNFTQWLAAAGPSGRNASSGFISLEHDMYKSAVEAAPIAFDLLRNGGFNVKRVGDCLSTPSYLDLTRPSNGGFNPAVIGAVAINATAASITTPATTPTLINLASPTLGGPASTNIPGSSAGGSLMHSESVHQRTAVILVVMVSMLVW